MSLKLFVIIDIDTKLENLKQVQGCKKGLGRAVFTSSQAQCLPSKREALLKMKHHLSDTSNRLASWSPYGINCCNWEFVVCNNITGHILELHLTTPPPFLHETSIFGGELHSSTLDLKDLNCLDLSGNDFGYMQIPTFLVSMASLRYLNLSHAGFGGSIPHHFWNLSNLIYLDLGGNLFEGSIPHQIGSLSNLIHLDLRSNYYLNGSIPHQIGNLSNLLHLGLGGNSFNGSIPQEIGNLSNLNYLQVEGSIPNGIQNLTLLQHLDLSQNLFNSSIPNWLYSFSHLKSLILSDNSLVGTISSNIGNLTSLVTLDLSGPIHSSLGNLASLKHLDLSNNAINEELASSLGNLTSLISLCLWDNAIHGAFASWLENLTSLMLLDLTNNQLNGNPFEIIGKAPNCWMTWPYLKIVNLENNHFTGILNISMGSFPWLIMLNLRVNNFFGNFPTFLKNTSNLIFLDLGKNQFLKRIPTWIGQKLSNLKILVLRSNKFCGPILRQICGMIKELLLKGRVYDYSTTLGLIANVDFSCNELSGVIPTEITALKRLHFSNFSNNHFIGQIPQNIDNMKSLESGFFKKSSFR
ncbi:receptor-like protein 19 [Prosopis cineraria]|uniref:receptor-like protein 19 n=1 Tax=Prosopis cineraria TaxID=364024 RepID=UPI0024101261|nr:receptor-like protein 19 [Prosopis cineraria]